MPAPQFTLIDLPTYQLKAGSHLNPEEGMCVMELSSYLAGESFTDHPACVSPVLGAILRIWNDHSNDEDRQLLKPYARLVLGTAAPLAVEARRAYHCINWLFHTLDPLIFSGYPNLGISDYGDSLPQVTDAHSCGQAILQVGRVVNTLADSAVSELLVTSPIDSTNCLRLAVTAGFWTAVPFEALPSECFSHSSPPHLPADCWLGFALRTPRDPNIAARIRFSADALLRDLITMRDATPTLSPPPTPTLRPQAALPPVREPVLVA